MITGLLFLYTVYLWIICALAFILHFLTASVVVWFFKDRQLAHIRLTRPFIRVGLFLCGIRVKATGLHHIPKESTFIIAANHQSLLDIITIFVVLNRKVAFIAKKELLKVPILSWDLRIQGHVLVDRSNAREAAKTLDQLKKEVQNGKNLLFFPEGTRSVDDTVGPFKKGAFLVILETGTTVVPIAISGSNRILNKRSFLARPGVIHAAIGAPIEVEKKEPKEARQQWQELSEQVRTSIISLKSVTGSRREGVT